MYAASLTLSSSHYNSDVIRSYILCSVPIGSLHHSSSPTTANVAKLIHSIRHFISPVHPLQPSSRSMRALPRCYCAPVSHRSKKPASISSPAIHTSFWRLVAVQNGILHIPLHIVLFSANTYMALLAKFAFPPPSKYVFFNLQSHRSPTILPCLYFHITCSNHQSPSSSLSFSLPSLAFIYVQFAVIAPLPSPAINKAWPLRGDRMFEPHLGHQTALELR